MIFLYFISFYRCSSSFRFSLFPSLSFPPSFLFASAFFLGLFRRTIWTLTKMMLATWVEEKSGKNDSFIVRPDAWMPTHKHKYGSTREVGWTVQIKHWSFYSKTSSFFNFFFIKSSESGLIKTNFNLAQINRFEFQSKFVLVFFTFFTNKWSLLMQRFSEFCCPPPPSSSSSSSFDCV